LLELSILTGGPPSGPAIPISQPTLPPLEAYVGPLREIFQNRQITNDRWVRELEARSAEYLGCREVVALANATSGLILAAKLLGLSGEVCLPTFTFPATLHALLWNGLVPRLVDCDPDTFNIDPDSLSAALRHGAKALVPVYIFGNSPDWDRIGPMLEQHDLTCYSDAAHALGTRWGERMAGNFGAAEVFSLAPTKVTVAGEGGLVATNDPELARSLRLGRNYGNPGTYDCVMTGLNARLSELHALLAVLCLRSTEDAVAVRHRLVGQYRQGLDGLPGIRFQQIDQRCRTTYNYVAVRIEADRFGLNNREVQQTLAREGIQSRIYFAPPLHRQSHFLHYFAGQGPFPGTELVLREVLCLPLYTHMESAALERVVEVMRACHTQAEPIRRSLQREGKRV
jgi:dTDP-4-amino-4,6-dideoxygalactose transaminase